MDAGMKAVFQRALLFVFLIWCVLVAVPALPLPGGLGLDPSWVLGINQAHAQGLAMGRDLVWTYGPLAYLSNPNPIGHHQWPALLYRVSMYFLWAAALGHLCFRLLPPTRGIWTALLFGAAAAMDPFLTGDHLEAAATVLTLVILLDESRWKTVELLALAFLAAVAMLVRYNLGIELIAVFLVLALQKHVWRRAIPALIALPAVMATLYFAETRQVAALVSYLLNGWELASGYSEAMSLRGPAADVAAILVALACLFAVGIWSGVRDRRLGTALVCAAVLSFFLFKNSVTRQDGPHTAPFFLKLAVISLFFWILARPGRAAVAGMIAVQTALLATGYFFVARVWPGTPERALNRLALRGTVALAGEYLHWPQTWQRLAAETVHNIWEGRLPEPFHRAVGGSTVDAEPWNIAVVLANGWRWNPRPVFQSYAAYTPPLDEMNANQIRSGQAADFVLVNWETIDERHPFFDDPFSWRARLDRYTSDYADRSTLLLRRRSAPIPRRPESLGAATLGWNQDANVPSSADWVFLHAEVRPTLWGKLRKLLFRLDPVWIAVKFRSGQSERWRVMRPNLESGVLLNQLPRDTGDIARLARGCQLPDPVVSMRLEADRPQDYQSVISIRWERSSASQSSAASDEAALCLAPQPPAGLIPVWGGAGSAAVAGGSGAVWTAVTNTSWITLDGGASGPGNRTVSYVVSANPGPGPRTGQITLRGAPYGIQQLGLTPGESAQLGVFRMGGSPAQTPAGEPPAFGDVFETFGLPGDWPVIGDWTGDGRLRIGVFRNGEWYLDLNGNRKWDGVAGGDGIFQFGLPGDLPVAGDWTGDGVTKFGVFRCPADQHGECTWVLDRNGNRAFDAGDVFLSYGLPGDLPAVSAWAGGRIDRIGVFRHGEWYVDSNGNGRFELADQHFTFGLAGDLPVVSRRSGKIGVYRAGIWQLDWNGDRRWDSGDRRFAFGSDKDRPLIAEW